MQKSYETLPKLRFLKHQSFHQRKQKTQIFISAESYVTLSILVKCKKGAELCILLEFEKGCYFYIGRQHWHLVDCPRRRPSHAPSFPPQTTSDLEKLQTSNIQRGSARGQLDPDEKRPENIPLPLEVRVITITRHSIRALCELSTIEYFWVKCK